MERHCKNCEKLLYESQNYCPDCGSRWVDYRLTPRTIAQEINARFLGLDNKLLRTLVDLVRFPERVIDGYAAGRRGFYVNPINFYIISLTLVGLQIFVVKNFDESSFGPAMEALPEGERAIMSTVLDYTGLIGSINLPIYALTGFLTFWKQRKYNFTEHFVFSLYIWGFYNAVSSVLTIPFVLLGAEYVIIGVISIPLTFVHLFYTYQRIFDLSALQVVIKSVLYIIILGILFLIALVLSIVVVIILFKLNPEWMEMFKPVPQ